jgi:hypothetical protein
MNMLRELRREYGEAFTSLRRFVAAAGALTQGVPVGNWTFMVHQLDVRGQEIVVTQLDANGKPVLDANSQPTVSAPT